MIYDVFFSTRVLHTFVLGFRILSTLDLLSTYYFITDRDFFYNFIDSIFMIALIHQIIAFSISIGSNHFGEICVHNPTAIGQTFKFRIFAI